MSTINIYFALDQSTLVNSRDILIDDIATVFSNDSEVLNIVKQTKLLTLDENSNEAVITAMYVISKITRMYEAANITSIGENETIIYYKKTPIPNKIFNNIKIGLVMLLAFFGTAYSIMSYHGDVGTDQLLERLYYQFMGSNTEYDKSLALYGFIAYAIGLCIGMVVLFNHGFMKKHKNDPTPLQVQMRLYEKNINQCIIIDNERKGNSIDVD